MWIGHQINLIVFVKLREHARVYWLLGVVRVAEILNSRHQVCVNFVDKDFEKLLKPVINDVNVRVDNLVNLIRAKGTPMNFISVRIFTHWISTDHQTRHLCRQFDPVRIGVGSFKEQTQDWERFLTFFSITNAAKIEPRSESDQSSVWFEKLLVEKRSMLIKLDMGRNLVTKGNPWQAGIFDFEVAATIYLSI